MRNPDRTVLFESMPIPRAIATLCIPTVVTSLVMVIYNIADTFFVGMLGDPVQNAAVTLASPVLLAFNAVNNLFGVGSSSMMSRALGAKDEDTVRRASAFGFYCALLGSLIISLACLLGRDGLLRLLGTAEDTRGATADYLFYTACLGAAPSIINVVMAYMVRAEGAALHASIGTMSGCILNMVLDPIMILPWGFNLGAAGAGLATCLSNCVSCVYFFVLIMKKRGRTCVCVSPRMLSLRPAIVRGVCGVGVPASIQNLLNVTGMTVLNNFAAAFGADAVAAMGIASRINNIAFQIALGLAQGVMPLIGYCFASRRVERMKRSLLFAGGISLGFITVCAGAYYAFAPTLVRLFLDSDVSVSTGARCLRALCLGLPFIAVDFMAVGVFQACGMGGMALLFAVLRKVVLEIPALLILNRLFPLYGLGYAQLCAESVLGVAAAAVLARLFASLQKQTRGLNAAARK